MPLVAGTADLVLVEPDAQLAVGRRLDADGHRFGAAGRLAAAVGRHEQRVDRHDPVPVPTAVVVGVFFASVVVVDDFFDPLLHADARSAAATTTMSTRWPDR